jgi:circadian clock protein KaiB
MSEPIPGKDQDRYLLKLYVTGRSPRAERAIANLRRLCQDELEGCYELQIIDILEHPQLAEDERILATPTLVKQLPPPLRRVIGDLSSSEKVLLGLDLRPREERSTATKPAP